MLIVLQCMKQIGSTRISYIIPIEIQRLQTLVSCNPIWNCFDPIISKVIVSKSQNLQILIDLQHVWNSLASPEHEKIRVKIKLHHCRTVLQTLSNYLCTWICDCCVIEENAWDSCLDVLELLENCFLLFFIHKRRVSVEHLNHCNVEMHLWTDLIQLLVHWVSLPLVVKNSPDLTVKNLREERPDLLLVGLDEEYPMLPLLECLVSYQQLSIQIFYFFKDVSEELEITATRSKIVLLVVRV